MDGGRRMDKGPNLAVKHPPWKTRLLKNSTVGIPRHYQQPASSRDQSMFKPVDLKYPAMHFYKLMEDLRSHCNNRSKITEILIQATTEFSLLTTHVVRHNKWLSMEYPICRVILPDPNEKEIVHLYKAEGNIVGVSALGSYLHHCLQKSTCRIELISNKTDLHFSDRLERNDLLETCDGRNLAGFYKVFRFEQDFSNFLKTLSPDKDCPSLYPEIDQNRTLAYALAIEKIRMAHNNVVRSRLKNKFAQARPPLEIAVLCNETAQGWESRLEKFLLGRHYRNINTDFVQALLPGRPIIINNLLAASPESGQNFARSIQ
jgi:hypothetical protein